LGRELSSDHCGDCNPRNNQCGSVVEETVTLKNRDDPMGNVEPLQNSKGGGGIR
jgi:hypothetical protein